MSRMPGSWLRLAFVLLLSSGAGPALAITGLWSGEMRDSSGQREAVSYRFSPAGNPVLGLHTRHGYQEVEIQSAGQQHRWLLPGSGLARGTVEALSVHRDRVQAVIAIDTESGGGELLDQRRQRLILDFTQSGRSLHATVIVVESSHSSGSGYGLYASSARRSEYRGVLHRQQ